MAGAPLGAKASSTLPTPYEWLKVVEGPHQEADIFQFNAYESKECGTDAGTRLTRSCCVLRRAVPVLHSCGSRLPPSRSLIPS